MNKRFCTKTILLTLLLSFLAPALFAQSVRWTARTEAGEDGNYEVKLEADIPTGYHMYDLGPYLEKGGPNETVISWEGSPEPVGPTESLTASHKAMDPVYGMIVGTYEKSASFSRKFRAAEGESLSVSLEWQICRGNQCLSPGDTTIVLTLGAAARAAEEAAPAAARQESISEAKAAGTGGESIWALILEAILWGFAMLLTPCVFPMVPMTISFFMKGSENKRQGRFKAMMYGLFIVLLYTVPISVIILLTRIIGGDAVTADIFNWLATHWLPNLIFFIVFMVFAASFFGAFEITLPSSIVNKADSKSDKKGLAGIFFMALTLVLVSFSCTGPIVGTVLIKSTSGEFWAPMVTMLAFSLAFALPFTVLALFPSLLKNLPKSGGWLNSVKVVLGFIEVALGFKFLSTADQTYHWGLLDREVYLAIWIVCFTLLGFYLLGKLRFANDSKVEHLSVKRLALSIVVFSFVVYMIPGMWGAPLKALSGYLPPLETQDFILGQQGPATSAPAQSKPADLDRKYSDFLSLPHGMDGYFDIDEAKAAASAQNKPLFVDVTGHGCVNCREMEAKVLSDRRVLSTLGEDFVICALYADDKKTLDKRDWVTTESGKVLKTLGKVNSHYALKTWGVNSQPCYIIIAPDGQLLAGPRGYDLDVQAYLDFLSEGLRAYRNR
ncbi:MAG: cytochrome c biogenesis protein CcdA [Bacteroidales bacterium]|nr:cytochrome c biogenesis protein CcdA [Bacteroidales bacterium]